jgi:hypothetical protein
MGWISSGRRKTSRRADFFSETLDKDAIIWYYKNKNIKQDERRIKNEKGEANQGEQDDGRWWGYQV